MKLLVRFARQFFRAYSEFGKKTFMISNGSEFRRGVIRHIIISTEASGARYCHDMTVIILNHIFQK